MLLSSMLGCQGKPSVERLGPDGLPLTRVRLMLNWYPEAEHGGYYAALVHGIYERYGLDVEIRPGGPNAPVAQELLTGRVEFAIANADDVLLFRQQKAPVVALLAPIQNTPRCILVHADSPATDLSRLGGLTLQANKGQAFLDFLQSKGLLRDVRVVPYSGNVANFVADSKAAIQAYSFSEPFLAEESGAATRCLMLSDAGFNPYASCLIATEQLIEGRADLARRMTAACREGWMRYLQDPAETNRRILELNPHGMTMRALEFGATALRPLCLPEGASLEQVGRMSADRWTNLFEQFVELGLADRAVFTPDSVFTTRFLE